MCSCIKQHPLFNIPHCKTNSRHTCVVCLDSKKIFLECKHCYSCKICKDCVLPLSKSNLDKQCPLCRAENWKDPKSLSSQVIPGDIELNLNGRIQKIYERPALTEMCKCCNKETYNTMRYICMVSWYASLIMFISYMIGLLFLFMCLESSKVSEVSPLVFAFVPLPLGFLIITLAGCCCCHSDCCKDTKRALCEREAYD